jgi:hypothetical protein
MTTPFGLPVDPDVNTTYAGDSWGILGRWNTVLENPVKVTVLELSKMEKSSAVISG